MISKELCISAMCPHFKGFSKEYIDVVADTPFPVKAGEGTCDLDVFQDKRSKASDCISPEDKTKTP